jgi:hypothetical protein
MILGLGIPSLLGLASSYDVSIEYCVAKWDYKSRNQRMSSGDVELSFSKGDKMKILSIPNENWLKVQLVSNNEVLLL